MAVGTKIEWTHRPGTIPATMNALVGCQKVSDGCRGCYAIETAHVRAGNPLPVMQQKFAGTTKREGGKALWTGKVTLSEEALLAPLRKKKPHTYFVNSMSDLFYDGVPDEWVDRHFAVFALCPQHTFIVLTKRPERMRAYLQTAYARERAKQIEVRQHGHFEQSPEPCWLWQAVLANGALDTTVWNAIPFPLPNVWLGVSVENQDTAKRVWPLLQTPAAIRFASCEPLLGPVDLDKIEALCHTWRRGATLGTYLDWVIAGGESGRGARPMHPDWARSLRDQCAAAGVPFFFKQWGEHKPISEMPESEYDALYVSRKIAPEGEEWRQSELDDVHGRRCTVPVEYLGYGGATGLKHAYQSVNGHGGMMFFRVGKKLAGGMLDGVQHHAFPHQEGAA